LARALSWGRAPETAPAPCFADQDTACNFGVRRHIEGVRRARSPESDRKFGLRDFPAHGCLPICEDVEERFSSSSQISHNNGAGRNFRWNKDSAITTRIVAAQAHRQSEACAVCPAEPRRFTRDPRPWRRKLTRRVLRPFCWAGFSAGEGWQIEAAARAGNAVPTRRTTVTR